MPIKDAYGDKAKEIIRDLAEQNTIPTILEFLSNVIADRACAVDNTRDSNKAVFDELWDVATKLATMSDHMRRQHEFRV